MTEPVLAIDRLSKSYGGLRVTNDVSLTVMAGEVHALIGPNGAGKTTLVAQISGALRADRGTVTLGGRDVTSLGVAARARQRLSRVFQISNVIGSFTAMENVALAAQAMSGSSFRFWKPATEDAAVQERAQQALESVGLGARANIQASEMSHGEKRAIELAMCLVQEPKLILLDEPMAGTGREETARLTELLIGLKGRISMLLVEHDMGTVFALADRITVLVGGAVLVSGSPNEVRGNALVRTAYLGAGDV